MEIIIAVVGSGALAAIISGIFGMAQKGGVVRKVLRQILYNDIKCLGRRYVAAGYVSEEDLEDLIKMHMIYHDDLKGNGYLDHIMNEVKRLRVKEGNQNGN